MIMRISIISILIVVLHLTFAYGTLNFEKIDSEDCESKGFRAVAAKKECEDAAVILKLKNYLGEVHTSALEHTFTELPIGCIYSRYIFGWTSPKNSQEPRVPCGQVVAKFGFDFECICAVGNCTDGKQNQGETDVDCGGPCNECETCHDGVKNQGEDDIDCGGPCTACPTCNDGIHNQEEIDVDCGGPCPTCPTCDDGVQNQGETAIDCGGPCAKCWERCAYEPVSSNECPTNVAKMSRCSLNMADGDLCVAPLRGVTLPDGTSNKIDNCNLNLGVLRCNRRSSVCKDSSPNCGTIGTSGNCFRDWHIRNKCIKSCNACGMSPYYIINIG